MSDSKIPDDVDQEMKEEEDNDSMSNSSGASSDEVEEEKVIEAEKLVDANPYTYENHVQLVTLCRKLGDLDRLRNAREKMSEIFPLTPELWLEWLTDEKNLATTTEQRKNLMELFDRAMKDYSSVFLWLEYVQFSIGTVGESWVDGGLENVRETFERAITAVGIHVVPGCLIWEAYREFETVYLLSLKGKNASEEEIRQQEDRIFNIFKRQLSVPLIGMEKTYAEFKDLFGDSERSDLASVDYVYKKACQKLSRLQEYEQSLCSSQSPHYEEYKTYIEFEKSSGEPIRVQSIYERALVENCLKEDLWLDYCNYMDRVVRIQDMSLAVHERAVRNCPWCVQLWIKYGRSLEKYGQPHDKIIGIFESALGMGLTKEEDFKELWLGYLDYLRRRFDKEDGSGSDKQEIKDVFDRALTQMNQYFYGSESQYVITKYWIFFVAKYKNDIVSTRQLWRDLIDCGHREEARAWLDYANFEKLYGDSTHYRKILLSAMTYVSDWPETFIEMLMTFERQEGTLQSFEKSLEKCEAEMKRLNEKRIKKMEEAQSHDAPQKEKRSRSSKRQPLQPKVLQVKNSKQDPSASVNNNAPVQMDSEGFKIPPPPPNKASPLHSPEQNSKIDSSCDESESKKRQHEDSESTESKRKKVDTHESHGVSVQHDPSKDDRTVFLSNLSYNVGEDKIREFCAPIGEIEEIRLVKDFKGRSKGYCYVVYKSELDAREALKKDREKLEGRPVLVSPCEDKKSSSKSHKKLKFSSGLEENKVFVKNIPVAMTEKEVEELFKEHGSLRCVRIVTYRNGHSKGLAYVEYEDAASASNAVAKMDGFVVQNKTLSVAISNPPPRKVRNEFLSASPSSFKSSHSRKSSSDSVKHEKDDISDTTDGSSSNTSSSSSSSSSRSSSSNKGTCSFSKSGVSFSRTSRGRGRTQLSLVPRAVARSQQQQQSPPKPLQNGSAPMEEDPKPLNNQDFADMLKK